MAATQSTIHDEGSENIHDVISIHIFGANKFVENIAIRRSGQVTVTVYNTNELIEVNPLAANSRRLVHRFDRTVFGIVEV